MKIIPKPKFYEEFDVQTIPAKFHAEDELFFCRKAFLKMAKKACHIVLGDGEDGIYLKYCAEIPQNGYEIEGRIVKASAIEGASYGLATMLQLMKQGEDIYTLQLQNAKIIDAPDKSFRGFMSDLARNPHDIDWIMGYVDLCYLNKVKYLHLHFTDDQAWTLPLDCFPTLNHKTKGFTKEEIRYLAEYAHEANVELIPEIEIIGHSEALNQLLPDRFGNPYDKEIEGTDNIMCIGKPEIFDDIKAMLTEIAQVFKYSSHIHIGCDEAKHEKWESCPLCRKYMAQNGLSSTLETYAHFVAKAVDMVLDLGKTPIVWEGFRKDFNHLISKKAIIVAWESYYQLAPDLLEAGFKIINASWKPMYIVPPHFKKDWTLTGDNWNVYNWQHFFELSPATENPIQLEKTDQVLGGMACQWECTCQRERAKVLIHFPQLADRTWNDENYYTAEEFDAAKQNIMNMQENLL